MNNKAYALFELLIAASLWGFGFIATTWVLGTLDASELTFSRFVLATLLGLPFLFLGSAWKESRQLFLASFFPGLFLSVTLILQTWGLKYTTPTKSSFITTLYVVFVPILEAWHLRRRLSPKIFWCVLGAVLGTALIVDCGFSTPNYGDFLTLGCALFATLQIYWLGLISARIKNPFAFNIYQCIWSILFNLPLIHLSTWWGKMAHVQNWPQAAIIGFLSLTLGSTMIAFFLQVRAQARLSPTVSSLMFLLESPLALIFSVLLLGQVLTPREAFGALLIFVAAFAATWTPRPIITTPDTLRTGMGEPSFVRE